MYLYLLVLCLIGKRIFSNDFCFFQEWNSDKLPIYEPGLDEVIRSCRGRNLVKKLEYFLKKK